MSPSQLLSFLLLVSHLNIGGTAPTTTSTTTVTSVEKIPGDGKKFIYVTVGQVGVWAIDTNGRIYYRKNTYNNNLSKGRAWVKSQGTGSMIDVGYNGGAWVYNNYYLYEIYSINSWTPMGFGKYFTDNFKEVAHVSENGLWCVDTRGNAWQYLRYGGWTKFPGPNFTHITVGEAGVWGVTSGDEVYFREGTQGHRGLHKGYNWKKVDGTLIHVSSGNDVILGICKATNAILRRDVSSQNPTGTEWKQITGVTGSVTHTPPKLDQVDTFGKVAWGVYKGDVYFIKL